MTSRRLGALPLRIGILNTRRVQPMARPIVPLYTSAAWRGLVADVIATRGRRCQRCGRTHGADGRPIRIFADHVVELKDGGAALDVNNLMLLCGSCHTRKTSNERAKRR